MANESKIDFAVAYLCFAPILAQANIDATARGQTGM